MKIQTKYNQIKPMNEELNKEIEINTKIILLFLEKLEKLTDKEREEILRVIRFINTPVFINTLDSDTKQKQETQRDLQTVITLLEGSTDRQKIVNFIKEYLLTN